MCGRQGVLNVEALVEVAGLVGGGHLAGDNQVAVYGPRLPGLVESAQISNGYVGLLLLGLRGRGGRRGSGRRRIGRGLADPQAPSLAAILHVAAALLRKAHGDVLQPGRIAVALGELLDNPLPVR